MLLARTGDLGSHRYSGRPTVIINTLCLCSSLVSLFTPCLWRFVTFVAHL